MDLITVTKEKDSIFKTTIRTHLFYSDMSIADGGNDAAPSPAEQMVSALGACIGMVINTYCESHGYNSDNINLSMTYLLNNNPKMIKNITIDIELPDCFPKDRHKVIFNLIKTCPIYNSFNPETEIDIEIDD